jgi:hypothetical protein
LQGSADRRAQAFRAVVGEGRDSGSVHEIDSAGTASARAQRRMEVQDVGQLAQVAVTSASVERSSTS